MTCRNLMSAAMFLAAGCVLSCSSPEVRQDEKSSGVSAGSVNNPQTAGSRKIDAENLPAITFDEETHDFGKVSEGTKVEYSFRFTNTGRSDLVIAGASASCGCTVPSWPKQPVKPGESEFIKVVFNSTGKTGRQNKAVYVNANTIPNQKVVYLQGEVTPAETNKQPN